MKKTLKILASAMLIIIMTAATAFAAEDRSVCVVSTGVEFVDQWNKAAKVNGTVKLDRDVNISSEYKLDANRSLTIDLNGHTISGVGKESEYIFNILSGSTMTIKDTSEAQNGRIIATKVNEDYEEAILVSKGGKLTLESGILQGNEDEDCRIVTVESGTFTMNGGSVTGNTYDGNGAGIYINEGSFTMNGGTVSDNTNDSFSGYGGGLYFDGSSTSKLIIKGGEFFGNSAAIGGAIYLDDGNAEITGGRIYKNTAIESSAIEISSTADNVTLAGNLVITENTPYSSKGAAVNYSAVTIGYPAFFTNNNIYLGGNLKICGDKYCDLIIATGRSKVHIMDNLDTESENHAQIGLRIGLQAETVKEYMNIYFTFDSAKDYSSCFFRSEI